MIVTIIIAEHPRARGENLAIFGDGSQPQGTSPRTRGKPVFDAQRNRFLRNIPAHAGKTFFRGVGIVGVGEHPRARGENRHHRYQGKLPLGTSPRTRGKHLLTCGSSFLRVILHSILFFCTVGVPWNPPAAPSFLSVLVPESSFTASSGPACFRLTAALFGGTVDDF